MGSQKDIYRNMRITEGIRKLPMSPDCNLQVKAEASPNPVTLDVEYRVTVMWGFAHTISGMAMCDRNEDGIHEMVRKAALREFHKQFYGSDFNHRMNHIKATIRDIKAADPGDHRIREEALKLLDELHDDMTKGLKDE